MMLPILPPTIMRQAITSVYSVMAVWMPVTVVPTSLATVAIETFITELSRVMTNWPIANVARTKPPATTAAVFAAPSVLIAAPELVQTDLRPAEGPTCRTPASPRESILARLVAGDGTQQS